MKQQCRTFSYWLQLSLIATPLGFTTSALAAEFDDSIEVIAENHLPQAEHIEQAELFDLVAAGRNEQAFELAFEVGDELFETTFNVLDGIGAQVGDGQLFTRVPRADLNAEGEWATHIPARATGPNAQACNACHNQPSDDGAGAVNSNVHRDPLHSGTMGAFITRNTPHLFGLGGKQRLAEEMTDDLQQQQDLAIDAACQDGAEHTVELSSKGVSFGMLSVSRLSSNPCEVAIDTGQVAGVDADLVIKPLQWKGSDAFIRKFNREASHNELGLQAVELVGYGVDGDGDGIVDEMTVGDQTALMIYLAAQPRPVSTLELDNLGLIPSLTQPERQQIRDGEEIFERTGCAACHVPVLTVNDPVLYEPSRNINYRDEVFPGGQDPRAEGVDPSFAVSFDLTRDQPDNIISSRGNRTRRLGSFERDRQGRALIRLYSDLKRHDMGAALAENIDEIGTGAATWLTKPLWGVGSTAPYLHDGRATTLTGAILAHGGEAATAQQAFQNLPSDEQQALLAFLKSLVLFKLEEA